MLAEGDGVPASTDPEGAAEAGDVAATGGPDVGPVAADQETTEDATSVKEKPVLKEGQMLYHEAIKAQEAARRY